MITQFISMRSGQKAAFKRPVFKKETFFRHGRAGILSIVVLSLALGVLWLGYWLPGLKDKKVELREIAIAVPPPPPPPPPPPQQQPVVETTVTIDVQGSGPAITIMKVEPKVEIKKPKTPPVNTKPQAFQSLEIDWDAFGLDQLDELPRSLAPLRAKLPKSLTRRGIKSVLVKLDILINENGQPTLIEVVQNPHPELSKELQRLVRTARFSPPKKDNQPVKARFIWPVEISL